MILGWPAREGLEIWEDWSEDAGQPDGSRGQPKERMVGAGVPEGHEDLSRHVFQRFRSLVVNQVIDIISPNDLDGWRRNFSTPEGQYLAAQMLSAAVIRTPKMINSSYQHISEIILPDLMRAAGIWKFSCIEDFTTALRSKQALAPLKIMPVDGIRIDRRPGNSAETVLRNFSIATRTGDGYLWRADDPNSWTHTTKLLVFIDDLLGTGRQFSKFAEAYDLKSLPPDTMCVYVPLLATTKGISAVRKSCPNVDLRPVEVLRAESGFFTEAADGSGLWIRDNVNKANDVRALYRQLTLEKQVPRESRFSMDLTVLLPGRTPNNSLRAYWDASGKWRPLIPR